MLILFKGKIIEGFWDEAIRVFRLTDDLYVVEMGGKRYICYSLSRDAEVVEKGIVVDELERCKYIGSYREGVGTYHIYHIDGKFIYIAIYDGGRMANNYIQRRQYKDIDIYCEDSFYFTETKDYIFTSDRYKNYSLAINKQDGSLIKFGSYISSTIFEEAEKVGKLEILQKLSRLVEKTNNIGRYNLGNCLRGIGVSFEDIYKELKKVNVQELLFSGVSKARMNFNRAVELMDKVKPWEGDYSCFGVEVDVNKVDVVKDKYTRIAKFRRVKKVDNSLLPFVNVPSGSIGYELSKVLELCNKYPLTSKLDNRAIRQWAGFLKALQPQNIRYLS